MPRPSLVGGRSPWYFGCSRPSKNFAIFVSASAQRCGSSLRYFSTCWSMAQFMNIARIIGAGPLMVIDTLAVGAHRSKRSEEHTSELQSLMRISYAVFCLKKKHQTLHKKNLTHTREDKTSQETHS